MRDYFARRAADYQQDSTAWPWSWLRAREARAVLGLLAPLDGEDVLELGCGAGFYTRLMLASGAHHVVATDVVAEMVARLPPDHVTAVVADAAAVTCDRTFRRILAAGLLEFVADAGAVLANARRHADPDGCCVVLVPRAGLAGRIYRRFHRGHGVEVHLFNAAGLAQTTRIAGWDVEETTTVWPFTLVARLRPSQ